jgi:hypothetical protein
MSTHPTAQSDLPERSPRSVNAGPLQRNAGGGVSSFAPAEPAANTSLAWCALVLAVLITGASLWLSLGMSLIGGVNLIACTLCLYQRTFIMGVASILLVGLFSGAGRKVSLGLLALPLALAGLAVAGYQFHLEQSGILECPQGLFGQGSAPKQSLAAFTMMTFLLLAEALKSPTSKWGKVLGIFAALVVAGGCTYGLLESGPKLPAPPSKPYDQPLNTCRRPYKAPEKH